MSNWSIGIYVGDSPFHLRPPVGIQNPVLTARNVSDAPAAFVADPFMVRAGDTWHMFFEVLNAQTGRGEIGLATSRDGFGWTYRQIVLRESFHLSYPHVFEWNNAYYMIPETLHPKAVRLYKAVPFPDKWSHVATLLDLEGVDPSPFRFDGYWWMFVCYPPKQNDTLRLYFAAELAGPWTEHPQSPIVAANKNAAWPGPA